MQKDARFADWNLYIDSQIFSNEHTLSEVEEKLLAEFANITSGYNEIFKNCYGADIQYNDALDSNGKAYHLNSGNIYGFGKSPDRTLRANVSKSVREAYAKYSNLMTQNFIFYIKTKVAFCKLQKYNSVLDSTLNVYKVDTKVYDNIIKYSRENLDLPVSYFQIKKKLLGLDEMFNYDMNAPIEKKTRSYTFEEGVEIIKKAMSVLGQEYVDLIERAVKERWIDVYPRDKKRSGGYTWGTYSRTYIILLNWTGNINDIFTLAHELGHAIQHYYTNSAQKMQNIDQPIFMAETYSTFNELVLADYFLNNSNDSNEKFFVLHYLVGDILDTVFTQANMSMFEDFCYKTIENNGSLSTEILKQKWYECTQKHYESVVNFSQSNGLSWQNIWHFYNKSYYVWQYALAFMISSCFFENLKENKEAAIKSYFTLLKGTDKYYPTEFLQSLGVDINSDEFYIKSFKGFRELFEQLAELSKDYKA